MPLIRAAALLALTLVAHSAAAQVASTDQKVRCASAYEQAQRTRKEGLLRASRDHLLVCAEETCPAVLRDDCVKWLGEVEQAMPTVIVVAKDAQGNDLVDVSVSIDGTRVAERLDGTAIAVDPGMHTFKLARQGEAVEQRVLVREGEKRRALSVTFGEASKSDTKPIAPRATSSGVPAATWILGSLGVVAVGAGVGLYLVGRGQKNELDQKPCAQTNTCDPDVDVAPVKRTFIYGDVAMGLGIAALAGAAVVWIAQPSPTQQIGIAPTRGGLAFSASLRF